MKNIFSLWLFCFGSCTVFAQKKYLIYKTDDGYDVSPKTHHEYVDKPQPFHFGYNIKDDKGNSQYHKEESDEHNYRKGSYGYTDAYGIYRHVDYVADHEGFRAKVRTNEPGTSNSNPAHVYMNAEEPPHHLQTLHQDYIKPTLKHYPEEKSHLYQQELDNPHYPQGLDKAYYQQGSDKSQEPYQQEELYHNQKQAYEEYHPNRKERVTYVPIYAPHGNGKANEYPH